MKETAYEDITEEMFKNIKPKSKVKDLKELKIKDKLYKVNGKDVILDYSKHEKKIAEFIENTFGGEIYMVPRINGKEKNIRTPDYIWNNETWDLKDINSHGKRTIDTAIKSLKKQSNNIILNINNNEYQINEIKRIINKNYKDIHRNYFDKILVIKNQKILLVTKRKRGASHQQ